MCRECRRSESQKRQQADENLHVSSQSTNFCVDDYFSQQLFCQPILNQTRHTLEDRRALANIEPWRARNPRDVNARVLGNIHAPPSLSTRSQRPPVGSQGSSGTTDSNITDKKCPLSPPAFELQARSKGLK